MNTSLRIVTILCIFLISVRAFAQDTVRIRKHVIQTRTTTSRLDTNEVIYDDKGNPLKYYQSQKLINTGEYSIKLKGGMPGDPNAKKYLQEATAMELEAAYERLKTSAAIPGNRLKEGQQLDIAPFSGILNHLEIDNKVVVMIFWSAGCPPCTESFESLNTLFSQIFNPEKMIILAITPDDVNVARTKLQEKPLVHAHLLADARNIITAYSLNTYPAFVVADKDHIISFAKKGMGMVTVAAFKKAIKTALEK